MLKEKKEKKKKTHNIAIPTTTVLQGQLFLHMTQELSKEMKQLEPRYKETAVEGDLMPSYKKKCFTPLMNE